MNSRRLFSQALFLLFITLCVSTFGATRTLTLATNGSGSITANPSNPAYPQNSVVQLTATASNGWLFHHWSNDASGSVNPYSLTMDANKSVNAVFVQPVTITGQPQNVSVAEQGTANFSVTASGAAPLSYAWRFNGTPIAGATATNLSITNVQPSNGGAYDVVVSNPYSSRTSTVAFL